VLEGPRLDKPPADRTAGLLKSLVVVKDKRIKIWDYVEAAPNDLLSAVGEQRLEGIVGKQKDSHYQP
jgi:ATP-dependent DNA ligase